MKIYRIEVYASFDSCNEFYESVALTDFYTDKSKLDKMLDELKIEFDNISSVDSWKKNDAKVEILIEKFKTCSLNCGMSYPILDGFPTIEVYELH
jgi:hypothetical protein